MTFRSMMVAKCLKGQHHGNNFHPNLLKAHQNLLWAGLGWLNPLQSESSPTSTPAHPCAGSLRDLAGCRIADD